MLLEQLDHALEARRPAKNHSEEEVFDHLREKYPRIEHHGRNVFLFTNERQFENRRHIVSFHDHDAPFTPEHIYQYVIIKYCYADAWTITVDGDRVELQAGDTLITDRFAPQSIEATGKDMLGVSLILDQSFFRDMFARTDHMELSPFMLELLSPGAGHASHHVYPSRGDSTARRLVDLVLCEHLDPHAESDDLIDHLIASLLLHLASTYDKSPETPARRQANSELMGTIREYIAHNFQRGNLQDMARDLGYERTYLSKFIRRMTGSTFKQLVNEERMRYAALLLITTEDPVYAIAEITGISSLTTFYQRFKEYAGVSPQEFRDRG